MDYGSAPMFKAIITGSVLLLCRHINSAIDPINALWLCG
ncbi:hypothetical protein GPUN_2565 [Glaciecola punicea ACAM 611]|uniref:Uncharacterized protein n=1 Tax=Glaciecola punicea ACAM 611 TaxID=1121923 RepID=H5TEF3_9ALTE|nr:hypothetical protein GPUN_2565 [Glaciecola punicea ACAM 611]